MEEVQVVTDKEVNNLNPNDLVVDVSNQPDLQPVISFEGLKYFVKVKTKCCSVRNKTILGGVSGILRPGLNALLGPTGSGKTSLLDVLAQRKSPSQVSGTSLFNGSKLSENFKILCGYVMQDDVVMGTLTVRENLLFSANLRLPSSVSPQKKSAKVQDVITELGLTHCADSKVGTELVRGISGGERKRTNIGMELIISPQVLFLDEPTTGLDASTATAVISLLHRLSRKGRNIIFSIHQPRYSIFKLFDSMTLLAHGSVVYHGPASQALQYFLDIGFECEMHNNPADFFLDVINQASTSVQVNKTSKEVVNEEEFVNNLVAKFEASDLNQRLQSSLSQFREDSALRGDSVHTRKRTEYSTSFFVQTYFIGKRAFLNIFRNPELVIMQSFVMVFFAIIVGVVYFDIENTKESGLQNRYGAFFFIVANQVFGSLSSVEVFIKERPIFAYETSNGFYRVSAFFLGKVFCDILPMRLFPCLFFCAISYFMIGFIQDAGTYFIFVLVVFLSGLSACSMGFAISASVGVFAIANLYMTIFFVMMMLFSGLMVNLNEMAEWLQWLKWFSIFFYANNGLCINEFRKLTLCSRWPNGTAHSCDDDFAQDDYLRKTGIGSSDWDLWMNVMAMTVIALLALAFTFVQLLRFKTK